MTKPSLPASWLSTKTGLRKPNRSPPPRAVAGSAAAPRQTRARPALISRRLAMLVPSLRPSDHTFDGRGECPADANVSWPSCWANPGREFAEELSTLRTPAALDLQLTQEAAMP